MTGLLAVILALDCVVRARVHVLRHGVIKAVRWAKGAEVQCGKRAQICSLTSQGGLFLLKTKQMCIEFQQHFAELYRECCG